MTTFNTSGFATANATDHMVISHAKEAIVFAWDLRHYPDADVRRAAVVNIRIALRHIRTFRKRVA